MSHVVVLIPPMLIIGETATAVDAVLGKEVALEHPAAFQRTVEKTPQGPRPMIQFMPLGPVLHVPCSVWPWRPAEKDEVDGYRAVRAQAAGIHLAGAGDMPRGGKH